MRGIWLPSFKTTIGIPGSDRCVPGSARPVALWHDPCPSVLQRSWATPGSPPSYEAPDKRKVIGEEHPIAEGQPMQAASGQREVLMDRQNPHRHTGDAKLEDDKEGGAIRQGQVHQGIRLAPAVLQVEQGQEGIQDGAHADQDCKPHAMPRQTIDIRPVSFPGPPKALSAALPAERTPERRGARPAIRQAALFEKLLVPSGCHRRRCLPEAIHV